MFTCLLTNSGTLEKGSRLTLVMAEYDLTKRISQYLDRHLVVPLLEYISVKSVMFCIGFICFRCMTIIQYCNPSLIFS